MTTEVAASIAERLAAWASFAERHWSTDERRPRIGWFGTGYNAWGVQTNQKYAAAMAALAAGDAPGVPVDREWALDRALRALRFSLGSHHTGDGSCTDGTRWGHTWISGLGVERMMYGVELLRPHLDERDLADLERVLTSEADWLLTQHRPEPEPVLGDLWAASGMNDPESNIWNGALLWRAAELYPAHPHAPDWRERGRLFLMNGVSVPADAVDDRVVDGRRVRDWHRGANFFPDFALDHHGYLNVGYMVICLSNAAILHFDLAAAGLTAPEALHHHQGELWQVVRRMIFSDGRLARIGGDSRVRYAYCQEYLLPTLLYAADRWGDPHAKELLTAQLGLIEIEHRENDDGSFYGKRLAHLARASPYYYTRLESDRACALGMVAAYLPHTTFPGPGASSFEDSVAGTWCAPEHGAVLHRSGRRFASFAWRAYGLTQGMCQPPDAGDLAEWQLNLAPEVRILGDPWTGGKPSRELIHHEIHQFDGGFVTSGAVHEGVNLNIAEGWSGGPAATTQLVVAALPDDRTVVGIQLCRAADWWVYLSSLKGLHLNIPNQLYNGYRRLVSGDGGDVVLERPGADVTVNLNSRWANVDGRLGVVGLYGASALTLDRSATPRGGEFESMPVEEVCFARVDAPRQLRPGETFLDVGWAVLSGATVEETASFAGSSRTRQLDSGATSVRAIQVTGADQREYVVVCNIGDDAVDWAFPAEGEFSGTDLVTGEPVDGRVMLPPGAVIVAASVTHPG
jgi:hypothetical protein